MPDSGATLTWILGQSAAVAILGFVCWWLANRLQKSIDNLARELKEVRKSYDLQTKQNITLVLGIPDISPKLRKINLDIEKEIDDRNRLEEKRTENTDS